MRMKGYIGMSRSARFTIMGVVAATTLLTAPGVAQAGPAFTPGAPGVGDPYFPLDGNGGYDVTSYDLAIRYDPASDVLSGIATIRARATQNLSRFDLDLDGLTVRAIAVHGRPARFTRAAGELVVVPANGLPEGSDFTTIVRYDGVPEILPDGSGFIHTDDGALVIGEPDVAATWFPVNDHPIDKASYTFHITGPDGLEAIANGVPVGRTSQGGWATWTWRAAEPMASY
nr:M1 family peptidase [Geodermatophilaceae bacterium]